MLAANRMHTCLHGGTRSWEWLAFQAYPPAITAIAFRDLDLWQRPAFQSQGHNATMTTTIIDLLVCLGGFKVSAREDGLDVVWASGSGGFALQVVKLS